MIMLPSTEPTTVVTFNNEQSRPRKSKSVSFEKFVTMVSVSSFKQYKSDLWYDKQSLDSFRQQSYYDSYYVQQYTQQIQQYNNSLASSSSSSNASSMQQTSKPTLALNDETRGCEQRCCMERHRRKQLSIQFILRVSRKIRADAAIAAATSTTTDAVRDYDSTKLATVAERCNEWAVKLASVEGLRDYYRAYYNYTTIDFEQKQQQDQQVQQSCNDVTIKNSISTERIESSYSTVSSTNSNSPTNKRRRTSSTSSVDSNSSVDNETTTELEQDTIVQESRRCKSPRLSSFSSLSLSSSSSSPTSVTTTVP
jgi:hypothetical protein